MARTRFALVALGSCLLLVAPADAQVYRSALHNFRLVPVAEGLVTPWSMAWLPNGDMLVTERPGRLRIVRDGALLPDPVPGIPEVHARGQGGLLDVQPHPDFPNNHLLYITFSKPLPDDQSTTALIRGTFENDALTNVEELFEGYVFISAGDRQAPSTGNLEEHPAQDRSNHHGVIIRLHEDGRIPADNPFIGEDGVRPETWSYGHRNPQGLAIHPETGDLWANEHGPQGGDELNLIQPGRNYGWPVIGYGVNYGSGSTIHVGTRRESMEHPVHFWVPSIATSGLMVYTGQRFPAWNGNVFVGGMAGLQLARLTLDGQTVVAEETLIQGFGRVRDVRQGPEGDIYIAIENRRGARTAVYRLEPAGGR